MAQTKRYEVRGMMEWHPEFRAGRTRIRVSFTGGHLCGGACTPATYETSDPVVQKVIEDSLAFRQGRIRHVMEGGYPVGGRVMGSVHSDRRPEGPEAARVCGLTVFEYRDIEDISDFLQFKKGVPLERLSSEEGCFKEAERLGVVLKKKSS